jgi:hypothetical protein
MGPGLGPVSFVIEKMLFIGHIAGSAAGYHGLRYILDMAAKPTYKDRTTLSHITPPAIFRASKEHQ